MKFLCIIFLKFWRILRLFKIIFMQNFIITKISILFDPNILEIFTVIILNFINNDPPVERLLIFLLNDSTLFHIKFQRSRFPAVLASPSKSFTCTCIYRKSHWSKFCDPFHKLIQCATTSFSYVLYIYNISLHYTYYIIFYREILYIKYLYVKWS